MNAQIKSSELVAQLVAARNTARREFEDALEAFGEVEAAPFAEALADAEETLAAAEAEADHIRESEEKADSPITVRIKPVQAKDKGRKAKRQAKFAPVAKPAPKPVDPIERLDEVGKMLELRSRRNQQALKAAMLAGPTPVEIMKAKAEIQTVVLPKEPTLASEMAREPMTREGIELRAFNARRSEQEARDAQRRLERQGKMALRQLDAPVSWSTETGEKEAPRYENPFERRARQAEEAKKAKLARQKQAHVSAVKAADVKWGAM